MPPKKKSQPKRGAPSHDENRERSVAAIRAAKWRADQKALLGEKGFNGKEAARKHEALLVKNGDAIAIVRKNILEAVPPQFRDMIKEHNEKFLELLTAARERPSRDIEADIGDLNDFIQQRLPEILVDINADVTCEELVNRTVAAKISEDQKNLQSGLVSADKLPFAKYDVEAAKKGEYRLTKGEKTKKVEGRKTEKGDAVQQAMLNVEGNIKDVQYLYDQYQQVELKRKPNTQVYEIFACNTPSYKLLKEHWKKMLVFITTDKFKQKSNKKKLYAIATVKSYPIAIQSVIRRINDEDIQQMYREIIKYNTKFARLYDAHKDNSELTVKEAENMITWDKFKGLEDTIITKYQGDSAEAALYFLYSQMPPRRSKDYRLMILDVFKPKKASQSVKDMLNDFSQDRNHYVVNKDGDLLFLLFNKYKTQQSYGQQAFYSIKGAKQFKQTAFKWQEYVGGPNLNLSTLSTKMKPYVTNLLKSKLPTVLIPDKEGDVHHGGKFASLLPDILEEFINGRRFGSTLARHSFIMRVRAKGIITEKGQKAVNKGALKRIAEFMGHAETQQASYERNDLTDENKEEDTLSLPVTDEDLRLWNKGPEKGKQVNDKQRFLKGSKDTSADAYKEVVDALEGRTSLDVGETVLEYDELSNDVDKEVEPQEPVVEPQPETQTEVQQFEVEAIVSDRKQKGKVEYLVKWKGFPSSENTFEPEGNLKDTAPDILREYKANKIQRQTRSQTQPIRKPNESPDKQAKVPKRKPKKSPAKPAKLPDLRRSTRLKK